MQDLLVLGVVPGTDYVIPAFAWVVLGLGTLFIVWNLDKIHIYQKLQATQTWQATSMEAQETAQSIGAKALPFAKIIAAELAVLILLAVDVVLQTLKKVIRWADAKANSQAWEHTLASLRRPE